uniref:Uncharacterized protein n=1 Tax=Romanomermis culicivorax TaxID=13658 RepID=A0A915JVR8_ROMCU
MIIINYSNHAHLNFDPTILQQATAASYQIAHDFPDYFHPRYLRCDPHCTEELTAVLLSWMCIYYKYYGAENPIVITQLMLFLFHAPQAFNYKTMGNSYLMALHYVLQCLSDTRAPNYSATEEQKSIIGDIHQEYQMEMDKEAKMKEKKSLTMLTKPAIPPKYQMEPAPIIATTTMMQAPVVGIRT